jgi:hypothetical protein
LDEEFGLEVSSPVYAPDTTTIGLFLIVIWWARLHKDKAAVKLHSLMDLQGSILSLVNITGGTVHYVNFPDDIVFERIAFYLKDRSFLDFDRLFGVNNASAFFITRAGANLASAA